MRWARLVGLGCAFSVALGGLAGAERVEDRPVGAVAAAPPPCAARGVPLDPRFHDHAHLGPAKVTEMLADQRRTLLRRYGRGEAALRRASITVPVYFHAISSGTAGRLTRAAAERQIAAMNHAYGGGGGGADTGVRFRLDSFEVVHNARWFQNPRVHEAAMKQRLRRGGAGILNLYTASVGQAVLGFSTFPQSYAEDPVLDGVVVDYRSLPGGAYGNYDRGYTAVHEVGHWLGLFHTFENGCESPGDGVDDTPYQRTATNGCPDGKDTCPQAGLDMVHNFMDYAWDACMREFTAGQGAAVQAAWAAYRA